ncbi:MAG: alpha/beta fold hydrolase [Chloroflexota bacterium]
MRTAYVALALIGLAVSLAIHEAYRTDMADAQQRIVNGSHILVTDYGDIEYAVQGNGPPVLLLHGSGGGYDQGLLLGRLALVSDFRQIAVSRFGYLRSPVPADASVAAQAAAYAALLDHLGVDRVIVLAGSGGGPSALQFAHDFPERTSALILVSAVSKVIPPGEQNALALTIIQTIQRSDFLYWLAAKLFQSQFLTLIGLPREVFDQLTPDGQDLAQQMLDVMHPMSLRRIGSFREGEQRPLDDAALGRIAAPTLILHARDDSLVVFEHAEHAQRSIPRSTLVSFDTGGHGLVAQINTVRERVSRFVNGVLLEAPAPP